ncbi:hypothetical protein MTO96_032581 [Rhipicephalus appendiculatus]
MAEKGQEGSQGRGAADITGKVPQAAEKKGASMSETRQDESPSQETLRKSSTALDSGYQDRTEDAARLEEDAPAARDSAQQIPDVREKCLASSSAGMPADDLIPKPSFQKQARQGSKSAEARLPSAQLPKRDGDGRQDGQKPVHVHGLENAAGETILVNRTAFASSYYKAKLPS